MREQGGQIHIFNAAVLHGEFVVGNHPHAKAPADVDENAPDFAGAHYAHGFPMQVKARQPVQGKIEFPGSVVRLVDAANGGEQQRHGVLRHGIGGIGGHVHYVDFPERVADVHVVVPSGTQGDQLYPVFVKPVDHLRVHVVVHKHADGFASPGQLRCVRGEPGIKKLDFNARFLAVFLKGSHVVGLGVKKGQFHFFSSP